MAHRSGQMQLSFLAFLSGERAMVAAGAVGARDRVPRNAIDPG